MNSRFSSYITHIYINYVVLFYIFFFRWLSSNDSNRSCFVCCFIFCFDSFIISTKLNNNYMLSMRRCTVSVKIYLHFRWLLCSQIFVENFVLAVFIQYSVDWSFHELKVIVVHNNFHQLLENVSANEFLLSKPQESCCFTGSYYQTIYRWADFNSNCRAVIVMYFIVLTMRI